MAEAASVLESLSLHLKHELPAVAEVALLPLAPRVIAMQVLLSAYDDDTWARIVEEVDNVARQFVHDASIDLEISVA